MKCIEYVLKLFDMTQQELADKLGIKRQNIDSWIRGQRKIPQKHLSILADIFKIPEEYFQKELTNLDKLEIQKKKINDDWEKVVEFEYENLVFDEERQQNISLMNTTRMNEHFKDKQLELDYRVNKEKLHSDIEQTLHAIFKNKEMTKEELDEHLNNSIYSVEELPEIEYQKKMSYANNILKTYMKFVKIIKKGQITLDTLNEILDGIISYQDGVNKDDEFTVAISKLVKEEEQKLNERIQHNKKMSKVLDKSNLFE